LLVRVRNPNSPLLLSHNIYYLWYMLYVTKIDKQTMTKIRANACVDPPPSCLPYHFRGLLCDDYCVTRDL
jgi:hypothetical protein